MIELVLERITPADPAAGRAMTEHYAIVETVSGQSVGTIRLRLSDTDDIRLYAGHVGYRVNEAYRGNHYAQQACMLLKARALEHGFSELWITCDPDNWPSRRTCERIGARLVEIIDLPEELDMYQDGERQKCRYLWQLD
ncbi:acetyltransferase (GNAT) family protein [Spirosoma oryzae]|uniref:Acetyltransferase (GNAT) family protein n=1 Tax=Spirosoma oryzae TaxID=1469603 RepID=A0A2T0T396_9BACT|nr:GNAT family N-acetyltransferase [Spirosoma oryzae]PRY40111.1 acetyltransferase (GNAT) family protein [Spirosoma oryzae]